MFPAAPDVYFPIEIIPREYAGHLLLAVELATRGLKCVLGFKGPVQSAMSRSERPGVLFYKGGRSGWRGSTIHTHVGLDPEAGIVYNDFTHFLSSRSALHDMTTTRLQFCYGADDHSVFTAAYPGLANRFHLTGSPRVSLWGSDGDAFYHRAASRIHDRYGTVALFASSGGFTHERYVEVYGQSAEALASARHFLGIAREVAASLPDVSVVIRPHPSDSWSAWHAAVADIPNMTVESGLDLSAWIRAASVVVHPGSSTAAFEAVCAGIPALSTGSNRIVNAATHISHPTPTAAAVIDQVHRRAEGRAQALPSSAAKDLLERKLHHPVPGAAQRVADVLVQTFDFAGPSGIARPSRRGSLRSRMRREPAGPEFDRDTPPPFKRDALKRSRVEQDVKSAQAVLGSDAVIDVQELGLNCFLIRPAT